MKVLGIVVGGIIGLVLLIELIGWIVSKRAERCWKRMSPEERRRYQEKMYKSRLVSNSSLPNEKDAP